MSLPCYALCKSIKRRVYSHGPTFFATPADTLLSSITSRLHFRDEEIVAVYFDPAEALSALAHHHAEIIDHCDNTQTITSVYLMDMASGAVIAIADFALGTKLTVGNPGSDHYYEFRWDGRTWRNDNFYTLHPDAQLDFLWEFNDADRAGCIDDIHLTDYDGDGNPTRHHSFLYALIKEDLINAYSGLRNTPASSKTHILP